MTSRRCLALQQVIYPLPFAQDDLDGGHRPFYFRVPLFFHRQHGPLVPPGFFTLAQEHVALLVQHEPQLVDVVEALGDERGVSDEDDVGEGRYGCNK